MKTGDKVSWESQSMGVMKRKTGTVIAEVPAGMNVMGFLPTGAKKSHIKFNSKSLMDRVLVAVPAGKDGKITHYYCPPKSVLLKQGNK